MKTIITTFVFCFFSAIVFSQDVAGYWKTINDDGVTVESIVHIYTENDGSYYGKVVKMFLSPDEDQDPVCSECDEDDSRYRQKVNGMVIMTSLEKKGSTYSSGEILDPNNGSTYRCKIWLDGQEKLKVRGYLGPFFRTQTWVRERDFRE